VAANHAGLFDHRHAGVVRLVRRHRRTWLQDPAGLGLLQVYTRLKKAPLSPSRLAEVNQYYLLGAFAEPLPHAAATEAPTLEDYAAQLAAASAVPSLDDQRRKKIAR
jgi:hypothetical protein